MSILLFIVLFGTLPFPILAAIEIADQYGWSDPHRSRPCRTDEAR